MNSWRNILCSLITLASAGSFASVDSNNGRSNRGQLSSYTLYCGSDLCTERITWNSYGAAVVTVEGQDGREKVFSCTERYGSGEAPWIKPGERYIFRLYESRRCDESVTRQREVDSLTVYINNNGRDPGRGGGGGGGRYGDLRAQRTYCSGQSCTYDISWDLRYTDHTVLTVEEVGGRDGEKVMACEGGYGQSRAPWITRGTTYIFRIYDSRNCDRNVGRYDRPVSQVTVRE